MWVFVPIVFSLSDFQSSGIYFGVGYEYGSKFIFFPSTLYWFKYKLYSISFRPVTEFPVPFHQFVSLFLHCIMYHSYICTLLSWIFSSLFLNIYSSRWLLNSLCQLLPNILGANYLNCVKYVDYLQGELTSLKWQAFYLLIEKWSLLLKSSFISLSKVL